MLWLLIEIAPDSSSMVSACISIHLSWCCKTRPIGKNIASLLAFTALAPNDCLNQLPLNMTVRMPGNITFTIRKRYETHHHFTAAEMQAREKRFATITAYDSFAKLFADEGINVMLVGDSLEHDDSGARLHPACRSPWRYRLPHSCRATWRANCLLLSDLPFVFTPPGTGM